MSAQPNLEAIRAHLRSVRDGAIRALAELGEEPAPLAAPPPTPEPRWMRLADYARARAISLRTLHNRIAEGLPTSGEGHARRILVADADAWLRMRGG